MIMEQDVFGNEHRNHFNFYECKELSMMEVINPKSLCKGFFLYIKRLSIFLFANTHNNNIKQKKDVTFMGTTKKISKTSISGLTPAKKKLLEKLKGTVTCSIDSNKGREELKYEK